MNFDWNNIIVALISLFAGGGIWQVLKAREDKKKTPYDMLKEMLAEQKRFYEERNAEYQREKLDSAEKSAVISKSQFCKHKYTDPNVVCPVDEANIHRLENRCTRCGYGGDTEKTNEDENN